MRPSLRYVFVATIILVSHARAVEEQKPELTEEWTPVPPIISAPANGVPSDAVVLFDGKNLDAWTPVKPGSPGWKVIDGAMVVEPKTGDMHTTAVFGDIQLHIEFKIPTGLKTTGQDRGNSGVFFMGLYELQVLDSYENTTYVNGQAGSVYKQHPPLVNASRPPGEWQTYDAVFIAPRFAADGSVLKPAYLTVFHNGVLVQCNVAIRGFTRYRGYPEYKAHAAKLPLELQEHNHRVAFRNIWVREIKLPEEGK